jgi:hypothetical protein
MRGCLRPVSRNVRQTGEKIDMQEWQEQAVKNNLVILEEGECQLCGAKTNKNLRECVEKASFLTHRLNHKLGIQYMTIFLCVDAHALQHAEIHGRWNNHFHLTRLNLILIEKIQWNYKLSVILSHVIDAYKIKHSDETIINPAIKKRGLTTITDVEKSSSDKDYINLVNQWATDVFESFYRDHEIAQQISDLLIKKLNT